MDAVSMEGNRLYLGSRELREWSCGRDSEPAHYQAIVCVGISPNGKRIVSVGKEGKVKVWDPSKERLSERIFVCDIDPEVSAVGVNDSGTMLAVGKGLQVSVYSIIDRDKIVKIEDVKLDCDKSRFQDKIVSLQWNDDENIACGDTRGCSGIIARQPLWKLL